jgi:hypothetical protein
MKRFPLVAASAASAASADALPNIDIQKMCQASEAAPFADTAATFDERRASSREKLAEDRANISASDHAACVLPAEYLPGYIEAACNGARVVLPASDALP